MIHGLLLGILVGVGACFAPGPINLEIIRRSIVKGPQRGLAFGLGALSADVFFLLLSLAGAGVLWLKVPNWGKGGLCLVGALLLFLLGLRNFWSKSHITTGNFRDCPDESDTFSSPSRHSLFRSYIVAFALTAASPTTIAFWILIALSVVGMSGREQILTFALPFVLGVVCTCTTWIFSVSFLSGTIKRFMDDKHYYYIDRSIGIVLIIFALCTGYKGYNMFGDHVENEEITDNGAGMEIMKNIGAKTGVAFDNKTTYSLQKQF